MLSKTKNEVDKILSRKKDVLNGQISVKTILMTPEIAAEFLKLNYEQNRQIGPGWLRNLTGQIKRDEWQFNGEPIVFDDQGRMINGQHRCWACINSGKDILVTVMTNVPDGDAAYETMDRGNARKLKDLFEKHGGDIAATVRYIYAAEYHGINKWAGEMLGVQDRPSDQTYRDYVIERHPDLIASVENIRGPWRQAAKLIPRSIAIFCHYMMAREDQDAADIFFEELSSGENLHRNNPVRMLREKLIADREKFVGRASGNAGMKDRAVLIHAIFKAWDMERNGNTCKVFRMKNKGTTIPILVGL